MAYVAEYQHNSIFPIANLVDECVPPLVHPQILVWRNREMYCVKHVLREATQSKEYMVAVKHLHVALPKCIRNFLQHVQHTYQTSYRKLKIGLQHVNRIQHLNG